MTPPHATVAIVCDRVVAQNGRAFFYKRFFDHCERARFPLLVVGDSPRLWRQYEHVAYVACPSLPTELMSWEGPAGLACRPFIAFDDPDCDVAARLRLHTAVDKLRAHCRHLVTGAEFDRLDALKHGGWIDEVTFSLERVLAGRGIRHVLMPTQSFLGFAASRLLGRSPGLRGSYVLHSDYPVMFFDRLIGHAPLDSADPFVPIRDAMYRRLAALFRSAGRTVFFRTQFAANVMRSHAEPPIRYDEVILPPAVDAVAYRPAERAAMSCGRPTRLLYAGRLENEKSVYLLPEIAARLHGAEWWIAGGGSQRDVLQARMPEARFFGHLDGAALSQIYREVDILVYPSKTDTFANVVAEAMASGLPVVVSSYGGQICFVAHGETGLLSDSTAASFAENIERLRGDDAFRTAMSSKARRFAERCSWDRLYDAMIRDLLARQGDEW